MKKYLLILLLLIVVAGCSDQTTAGKDFPSENIEIIAPASPGGGWDLTARSIQRILASNEIVEQPINVQNKPGGGGEVGWRYLERQNGHTLSVNSSLLLSNNLLGQSQLTYEEFTPIAILATEWIGVSVRKDSEIKTINDLTKQLKKDPKSLKVGVAPGLGNGDHLSFVQGLKEAGVDPTKVDFVVYDSGGEIVTALLGGHIDVVTTAVSEAKEQYKAGKVNILAVSSDKRIEGLEDVPTWKEQGIDMVFPHWRGIMGPPNMSENEIAYWDEAIGKMVQTEEWKKTLDNNEWNAFYKDSKESMKFLQEQNKVFEDLLKDSGLLQ